MRKVFKKQIFRKYTDFYTEEDIQEPSSPVPNLSIDNFDRKGLIVNPEAPCLAITIDPDYVKDCNKPLKIRKFLVKSDILCLRNITRTKFFYYATKQKALEKDRENEMNTNIFKDTMAFYQFCFDHLSEVEQSAFRDMRATFEELQNIQKERPSDERSRLELEHQKVYTKANEVYRKFRFLLKLIDYFDNVSQDADDTKKLNEILKGDMYPFLATIPENHGVEETNKIREYMETIVKPYLAKKNYLNADIWWKGYQSIRTKIFNYNRHLSRVSLLNHIVAIIYDKFLKWQELHLQPKIFLKKQQVLRTRSNYLKLRTKEILDEWEKNYRIDDEKIIIAAVAPTVATNLGLARKSGYIPSTDSKIIIQKFEIIQEKLMELLNELDYLTPYTAMITEKRVRHKTEKQKKLAKQSLVKQTRMINLLQHYKDHYKKKNIVKQYTTLLPRHRGRVHPISVKKIQEKQLWK